MNTLDTRDLYKRKCELEELRDAVKSAKKELQEAQTELENHEATERGADCEEETWDDQQASLQEAVEDAESALSSAESDFSSDEQEELAELENLESEISDLRHGEQMIPESDFTKYAEELAEEVGDYDSRNARWPYTCIDWEKAADDLKMDYTSVTYQGTDYLVRA